MVRSHIGDQPSGQVCRHVIVAALRHNQTAFIEHRRCHLPDAHVERLNALITCPPVHLLDVLRHRPAWLRDEGEVFDLHRVVAVDDRLAAQRRSRSRCSTFPDKEPRSARCRRTRPHRGSFRCGPQLLTNGCTLASVRAATINSWPAAAHRVPSVSAIGPAPRTPGHSSSPGRSCGSYGRRKRKLPSAESTRSGSPDGGRLHDGWHYGLGRTCSGHCDHSCCQRPGGSAGLRRMGHLLGGTSPGPHAASAEQPCSLTRKDAWIGSTWWRRSRGRDAMMKVHGRSSLLVGRECSAGTTLQLQRWSLRIASSVPWRDSRRHPVLEATTSLASREPRGRGSCLLPVHFLEGMSSSSVLF